MRCFKGFAYLANRLAALLLVLLLLAPGAMAADKINAELYKMADVQYGTVAGEKKVNVRKEPDVDSDKVGRLAPGEGCRVIGEVGDWWQVQLDNETGYVLKRLLNVSTIQDEVPVIIEDPLEASLSGLTAPTLLKYKNDFKLSGTVSSNIPLVGVTVEVYNERTFSVDRSGTCTMKRGENVLEYDLSDISSAISFNKLNPGEKKLIIRAESANESCVLSETSFYVYTNGDKYDEPANITRECAMEATNGYAHDLRDSDMSTRIGFPTAEDSLTITLPEGKVGAAITMQWQRAPKNVKLVQLDEEGRELSVIDDDNPGEMIHLYYELDEAARSMVVSSTDPDREMCELRVYEKDRVSRVVQQWEPLPEKVDMLVISTHQDDELLFFGGTIPYYTAQGKTVGVVYMANCSRRRYAEALDGLWSCGLKYHPVFVHFKDKNLNSYSETVDLWGMEKTENTLVDLIRRYRPEVIVTHDVNGEYGHNQHKLTSAAVRSAVSKAGDAAVSPDSAAEYGVWTPRKLYIHLYEKNSLTMEVYDEPVAALDGMTTTQLATVAYSKHVSQQGAYSMEKQGVKYDNRKYGLAFTTVGDDVEKNDLFENID